LSFLVVTIFFFLFSIQDSRALHKVNTTLHTLSGRPTYCQHGQTEFDYSHHTTTNGGQGAVSAAMLLMSDVFLIDRFAVSQGLGHTLAGAAGQAGNGLQEE